MEDSPLNTFGGEYASIYDEIYSAKDYSSESAAIVEVCLQHGVALGAQILDVGCGTGRHALLLSQAGYEVTGTDISEAMLDVARSRSASGFDVLSMDEMQAKVGCFDLVYSLFDVLSYQTSVDQAVDFLARLSSWAKPEGIVVVDAWHLPGLILDPPQIRRQTFDLAGGRQMTRISTPTIDWLNSLTQVKYEIELRSPLESRKFTEEHLMRAFTSLELCLIAERAGLDVIQIGQSPTLQGSLVQDDWHIALIARVKPQN
jgi:SAM-dependent methyltransferase